VAVLREYGQSIWLDFIRRRLLQTGELARLVAEDHLGGLTSNPAIFEKAIAESDDYAMAIEALARDARLGPKRVFELLAIRDIQDAADVLRSVYDQTQRLDGYVSLEVAPDLANDAQGTLEEARRLWHEVARPNLMIKVPATAAGLVAIGSLIAEGINVNVTLLFAREMYEQVAHVFIDALTKRKNAGLPVSGIASVASFFVSRIDTLVDTLLGEQLKTRTGADRTVAQGLLGKVAIANAKVAYQSYKAIFSGPQWQVLSAAGAQTQRLLWASTGTKNRNYSDVLYVEELIGPQTVNTVPPETLAAFRDHGRPAATLEAGLDDAHNVLAQLESVGISLAQVTEELLADGLKKFVDPFTKLLDVVDRRCREANPARQ
jgi:transaldolase/glucose-6-phosphate isomerase